MVKKLSPHSPPRENVKESYSDEELDAAEKIYISLVKAERIKDASKKPVLQANTNVLEDGEERENQDIYINSKVNMLRHMSQTYDMGCEGLRPYVSGKCGRKRGSYNKLNAVKDRIADFLDAYEFNFGLGYKCHKTELEYWIQRLGLAQDRLAVKQYLKRFLMNGYFKMERGVFVFLTKNPSQPTLTEILDVQKQIQNIRAVTSKRRRKRSF